MILPTGLGESSTYSECKYRIRKYNSDTLRGSHIRSQDPGLQGILVIPPVDRSTLITSRDRRVISENVRIGQNYPHEETCLQGTSTSNRRDYLEDSSDDNRLYID